MGKDIIFWAAAHILIEGLMPSAENLAIITTVALLILWIASAARRKGATLRPAVASEVPYRNETGRISVRTKYESAIFVCTAQR